MVDARELSVFARLAPFGRMFEATRPEARARALEIAAVAAIVAAGAALRFWGLGAVGLHGDEKTMALPTMHLVEQGTPRFPSGMFYARGIAQLYLMAGAVEWFGQSAWSFRLPSALCGILLIVLAYLAGRRFLSPSWNLAFTAAVAFLPSFIEDAQTARMYVFLITCVAGYVVLLFEWERTGRDVWLAAAALVLVTGIQFHQLAIFAAFLTLYPGLVRADGRKLLAGLAAFAVIAAGFHVISGWVESAYPQSPPLPGAPPVVDGPGAAAIVPYPGVALIALAAVVLAVLGVWLRRALPRGKLGAAAAGLIALAPFAQLLRAYHIAFILVAAGLIAASRALSGTRAAPAGVLVTAASADRGSAGRRSAERRSNVRAAPAGQGPPHRGRFLGRLGVVTLLSAAIFAAQIVVLAKHGVPLRERAGLLLGWPSVWPFWAIAQYSSFAALLVAAAAVLAGWRLAQRLPIPDFLLFLALGVWIPLLMIGCFRWNIPPRYAAAQIFPLLLGAFAAAQWLARLAFGGRAARPARTGEAATLARGRVPMARGLTARARGAAGWQAVAAAAVAVLAVDPLALARTVDAGYQGHPDHLGAALFIRSQHLGPRDIVIAEDVIMQTYYLGHVDYWLIGKPIASQFVYWHDGRFEDFYTNTPIITSARELERLIARRDRGAIYIIGSGEQQEDGRAYARGESLERFLTTSPALHVLYVGRDGVTKVWKIPAPAATAARTGSVARAATAAPVARAGSAAKAVPAVRAATAAPTD